MNRQSVVTGIPRAQLYSPRERLQIRGLSREVLGYASSSRSHEQVADSLKPATGNTQPINVANVSREVFPSDINRKFIFIQNNDAVGVVFVSIGGAGAAINQGFRLGPGGGGVLLDNNVPTDRIFMIGTVAANPNVTSVVA
jgi:hypothetical protein